jgi:hypothetical protein
MFDSSGTPMARPQLASDPHSIFDRTALASPIKDADRELCDVLIRYAKDLLANAGPDLSFTGTTPQRYRRVVASR